MRVPELRTSLALAVCLAIVIAVGVTVVRSADQESTVTVLANWTGTDAANFQSTVLGPFEAKYHIKVVYQGTTAESQVLRADVESGTPPDVAVLPGPGELAGYARNGELDSLDQLVSPHQFSSVWMPQVDGHYFWLPVKVDLKSLVWYPSGLSQNQVDTLARTPADWCLGMSSGATSGWPGADWIADILLQQAGWQNYQKWVSGRLSWQDPLMVTAWQTWGRTVGAGANPRTAQALSTPFQDMADGVSATGPGCKLEHQASFVREPGEWTKATPAFLPSADLIPGALPGPQPVEVSADLAGMFRDTPQAEELITYLASAAPQQAWSWAEYGFSADTAAPSGSSSTHPDNEQLAALLDDPTRVRCFDASDAMPPPMRDAFILAVLHYLAAPQDLHALLAGLDAIRTAQPATAWLSTVCDR